MKAKNEPTQDTIKAGSACSAVVRLRTEAGSEVRLVGKRATVDFDWFEEDHACIDCEVDFDASRDTGWTALIWGCCDCTGGMAPLSETSDA